MAATSSFEGALTVRIFLGLFEAAVCNCLPRAIDNSEKGESDMLGSILGLTGVCIIHLAGSFSYNFCVTYSIYLPTRMDRS